MLALLLGTGCSDSKHETAPVTNAEADVQEVRITIDAEKRILLNDEVVALKDLYRKIVDQLGDEKAEFVITATSKTPMNLISDVRQQLPPANTAGLSYPLPQS